MRLADAPASLSIQWSPVLVCFVALRPKSTAMVMAGRLVHLGQAVNQYFVHILSLVNDNNTS